MSLKFIYMKLLGLFMTVVGFAYCLTSFYNFFDVLLGEKLISQNVNILIASIGLFFPLFVFIFGVYFYFYADVLTDKSSKLTLIGTITLSIISIIKILLGTKLFSRLGELSYLIEFIHPSFGYVILLISFLLIYGKFVYKY